MKFLHEDKNLEKAIEFNEYKWVAKEIGPQMTKIFKKRIIQIRAANNFSIFLSTGLGHPHPLSGNLEGCYGIHITANFRLVVKPIVDSYDPKSLIQCDTVLVKGVTDYHDGKYKWILP